MARVVLVTGASRGIGREVARQFALAGDHVAINCRQHKRLAEELAEELRQAGGRAEVFPADIADRSQVLQMIGQISRTLGRVDVLVNNAGFAQQKLFTEISEAEWLDMFAVHVNGAFHCCQAVLPHMIRRQSGRIINISSIWGLVGASCEVHYSAAKAALIGMTRALAKELGPSGIQVNCIAPGVIDTEMNQEFDQQTRDELADQIPLGRFGTPGDIARTAFFLASDQADYLTGQVISPNGGMVV
ncbi:MAG: SDR family oxidoreductase [Ruminococcaceae bacterium]|jgi:3-oxoacyl-[acyl-carrier protein] reductase|nr:SDR family oxidoreductase [Oscillospiraceae bacterium]